MPPPNLWKPDPAISDYYARIDTTGCQGHCPHCRMTAHAFGPATVPAMYLRVWQHAPGCPSSPKSSTTK